MSEMASKRILWADELTENEQGNFMSETFMNAAVGHEVRERQSLRDGNIRLRS